jgi:DNA-binding CsgD family transcriptional regulator
MTATFSETSTLSDVPSAQRVWVAAAFLLAAITRDALGGPDIAAPVSAGRDREALTHGETRVLHYLPTNLSAREIAGELYLSVNTVKTHQRHLYAKLGARSRTQAVDQARALGLLAPSGRRRLGGGRGSRSAEGRRAGSGSGCSPCSRPDAAADDGE